MSKCTNPTHTRWYGECEACDLQPSDDIEILGSSEAWLVCLLCGDRIPGDTARSTCTPCENRLWAEEHAMMDDPA